MLVYLVTNNINGKYYVGKTTRDLETRWKEHCYPSQSEENRHLARAIQKYGEENFSKELLFTCNSLEEIGFLECLWIVVTKSYDPQAGYNLTFGGDGLHNPSELTRKKMSLSHIGSKRTKESIEKQKESNRIRWTKLKAKGFTFSEECLARLRNNAARMKGKTYEEIYGSRAEKEIVNHSKGLVQYAKSRLSIPCHGELN